MFLEIGPYRHNCLNEKSQHTRMLSKVSSFLAVDIEMYAMFVLGHIMIGDNGFGY